MSSKKRNPQCFQNSRVIFFEQKLLLFKMINEKNQQKNFVWSLLDPAAVPPHSSIFQE